MGGAASSQRLAEPSELELEALDAPYSSKDGEMCFNCIPQDPEAKRKHGVVVLEISTLGIRILRPDTSDCISFHSWGSLHSWSCSANNKFIYRYWDDLSKSVQQSSVYLRDVHRLLEETQHIVQSILDSRRDHAIGDEVFSQLLQDIRACVAGADVDKEPAALIAATAPTFLWSSQGRALLEVLPNSFDKVEAAVQLHQRLIDQNRFTGMLDALDCQADRDNVWHRVTQGRRKPAAIGSGGGSNSLGTISVNGH